MRLSKALALLTVASLVFVACGDDKSSDSGAPGTSTGSATQSTTTLAPKVGGSITFAVYGESAGLDPTINSGTGVVGGIELVAVYDTLIRYDPSTGKYVPRMAQSLEPNADFTRWTLK